MKRKLFLSTFIILFCTLAVQAQVQFNAKVSKATLGINERLRVDFTMNRDGDNFKPPSFEGFRVVGGPNQSISNTFINGKRSYAKTYSYFLSPMSTGKFTISQAKIEIEGETYKTLPISVTVTTAVDKPKDGNDAEYIASENVHLVAEVSNGNPFLNEAITVVYKMYVSNEVSITSSWREIDTPKYADFWSQNIDNKGNFKIYNGKYKGKEYRYVILRTTVLYPQKTGKLTIEPLTLDVPIDVQSNRRDLFGRRLMSRVNKTISAGKRTIDVKPLPLEGQPDNFTGAVGNFSLDVSSTKTTLDANESLDLEVKVSGEGNLKLFNLPSVKLPNTLEVYEPQRKDNINTFRDGMKGAVSEIYTVVPQAKGEFPIRPVSFSYFNPKTETYTSLSSQEIVLTVENGPQLASQEKDNQSSTNKQEVVQTGEQFKYIKLNGNLVSQKANYFFQSTLYWTLLCVPFLLIPIFIVVGAKQKQRKNDVVGNKLRRVNKLAKKYLSEAKNSKSDKTAFYEALARALHNYLKAKLQIETSDFSKERISNLLLDKKVTNETTALFISLLKSCELARFTPSSATEIDEDYEKAVAVITAIDKQIQKL